MKLISLLIFCLFQTVVSGQNEPNIDSVRLKEYVNYLHKQNDNKEAAKQALLLAKFTENDEDKISALKLTYALDSLEKSSFLISELKDPNLKLQWYSIRHALIGTGEINGKDSIYYSFIQLITSNETALAQVYFQQNRETLSKYPNMQIIDKLLFKSPKKRGLAAIASLVPGLGKLYIGRRMDALGSFTNTGMLSGLTFVFLKHLGNHPLTYISAGLAGGFYIAGIIGTQTSITQDRTFNLKMINEKAVFSLKYHISQL